MALGILVTLVIEVEGAGNIKKCTPVPPRSLSCPRTWKNWSAACATAAMEDEETIQRRLKRAETEIANSVNYDEHVVNIAVDSCAESLYSIIQFDLSTAQPNESADCPGGGR